MRHRAAEIARLTAAISGIVAEREAAESRARDAHETVRAIQARSDVLRRVLHVVHLEERPATEAAPVVHRRDPEVGRCGDLRLLLLLRLARDLEQEREQVISAR